MVICALVGRASSTWFKYAKRKKNIVLAAQKPNWKCKRIGCFNRKKTKGIENSKKDIDVQEKK